MPSPLMEEILKVMPDDGTPIHQTDIYNHLGYAKGVGVALKAMAERGGLIKWDGPTWRSSGVCAPDRT